MPLLMAFMLLKWLNFTSIHIGFDSYSRIVWTKYMESQHNWESLYLFNFALGPLLDNTFLKIDSKKCMEKLGYRSHLSAFMNILMETYSVE